MKQLLLLLLLFSAGLASCQQSAGRDLPMAASAEAPAKKGTAVLPLAAYQAKMAELPALQLLDVRTPPEFAAGHIPGAINCNLYDDNFAEQLQKLDKNRPVMLYCRSGARSATASKQMEEMGFSEIYDLRGGYLTWPK
jgi:phage shock protein E